MKTLTVSDHALLIAINLIGSGVAAYADNMIVMTWCYGWALYSLYQIAKLLEENE